MRLRIHRVALFAAILAAFPSILAAQSTATQTGAGGSIFAGETLKYDAKLNKIIRGISLAELSFSAAAGSGELVIRFEAVSKGTLLKLFRYSFLQQYESTAELADFRILKTTKHDVQKQRVRDSEALFNYKDKRVTYIETDPKDKTRPPRRIASEIDGQMQDMVSAVYALRLKALAVGKRFELSVGDSGLVFKVPVVVVAREMQKTIIGDVSCFRIEAEVFGKGRLIEQDGKMVIWLTDDARRTPVRARINTEYGTIHLRLKSVDDARQF
jgi:hypothetical protein